MSAFDWIEPHEIRFSRAAGGRLSAVWGLREGIVTAKRLFPFTKPASAVAISDMEGVEWGVLRSTEGLDRDSLQWLEAELRIRPFVPRIERIISLERRFGRFVWDTLTDCGPVRFETGPLYEAVFHLEDGSRVVSDVSEQQYVLPADQSLLRSSLKRLVKWL